MVNYQEVRDLSCPQYESFTTVSRCIHFADFHNCWERKALVTRPLSSTIISCRGLQVLWMAPSKKTTEHNFYGNMTFTIDFNELLEYVRPANMYYVDQIKFSQHMVTRILLTRHSYSHLKSVNTSAEGSPLKAMNARYGTPRDWQHATSCHVDGRMKPHELEIAFNPSGNDSSWLFRKCRISANNHSKANTASYIGTYADHVCHRFNTFRCQCPHSLDDETSVRIVRSWVKSLEKDHENLSILSSTDRDVFAQEYKKVAGYVYDNRGGGALTRNMSFWSL
ncbi:uncharacterized protein LOC108665973 [Hyalella azteca]|uniref:Uncharacterized protein LOC108665973 n=1 Tax=Hyalella azteca TaxID=294128 RepID=A0A8B7N342_HYAAZ|nr:uncharacterized protein LOC108665973 [Hyalella azteca]